MERDRDRRPVPTFKAATVACHAELKRGWTVKHADAFLSTLTEHGFPKLAHIRVDHIEASTIRDALAPIWMDKPVMARKVRQRIGTVLNFSKSKDWRASEAPTKAVTVGLSRQPKGGNFSDMPYVDVPAFVQAVEGQAVTVGRLALLLTILTGARTGEVRSARWSHVDLKAKVWHRPAPLMKSREAHTVTLSDAALRILSEAAKLRAGEDDTLIFAGKGGKPISDMTLTKVLRDAGQPFTAHGFRSSFRDWAAEKMSTIPEAVAEAALAHAVSGIGDLVRAIDDPDRYGSSWTERLAGSAAVPAGVAQLARTVDPTLRDADGILDSIRARVPGLSSSLPPRRDVWGQPIIGEGGAGPDLISPAYVSTLKNDPVNKALLAADVHVSKPQKKWQGRELRPKEYGDFHELSRSFGKAAVADVIALPDWKAMSQEDRQEAVSKVMREARKIAGSILFSDDTTGRSDPWAEFPDAPASNRRR